MSKAKYIIERSLLQPGDIILTGGKTRNSLAIRIATASRYSHAAIYVGDTTIEATLDGVFSKNPQRLIFDDTADVAVYRSKRSLSEREMEKICAYARSKTGSLYALSEAITMRARSALGVGETKRQFCSRLVAESYAFVEYDFINLRNPSYCTPRQLSLCKAFEKIFGIERSATNEEIAFAETSDPNMEHQRQTFEWLGKVRAMIQAESTLSQIDVQTINDVDQFLLRCPQFDSQVASFMETSGYLDFYNHDTKVNPFRYNKNGFEIMLMHQADVIAFLEREVDKEPTMFTKFASNLEGYIQYSKKRDLKCFRHHLRLYINLITGIHTRLEVITHGYNFIGEHETAVMLRELSQHVLYAIKEGARHFKVLDANGSQRHSDFKI